MSRKDHHLDPPPDYDYEVRPRRARACECAEVAPGTCPGRADCPLVPQHESEGE